MFRRLHEEVIELKAKLPVGQKFVLAPIEGINNNNLPFTNEEDIFKEKSNLEIPKLDKFDKKPEEVSVPPVLEVSAASPIKEDYEEEVKMAASPRAPVKTTRKPRRQRASPVESAKSPKSEEEPVAGPSSPEEPDPPALDQEGFLRVFGLVTNDVFAEMQSRRKERKRRSTANPNYIWEAIGVSFYHCFKFWSCRFISIFSNLSISGFDEPF